MSSLMCWCSMRYPYMVSKKQHFSQFGSAILVRFGLETFIEFRRGKIAEIYQKIHVSQ